MNTAETTVSANALGLPKGSNMTAQSQTSRRLFLAAGSASAVFGALAQAAAAAPADADPIFAAIERHEAAEVRYCAACNLTDDVAARQDGRAVTEADAAEFDEAVHAYDEALSVFLMTPPTTVAGLRAFLRHCLDDDSIKRWSLCDAVETALGSTILVAKH
jgi:hypothetical protein